MATPLMRTTNNLRAFPTCTVAKHFDHLTNRQSNAKQSSKDDMAIFAAPEFKQALPSNRLLALKSPNRLEQMEGTQFEFMWYIYFLSGYIATDVCPRIYSFMCLVVH